MKKLNHEERTVGLSGHIGSDDNINRCHQATTLDLMEEMSEGGGGGRRSNKCYSRYRKYIRRRGNKILKCYFP